MTIRVKVMRGVKSYSLESQLIGDSWLIEAADTECTLPFLKTSHLKLGH